MDKLMHHQTFSYWGKRWLEMNEYNFSLSYYKTAEIRIKGINQFIGDMKIEDITPFHVDEMILSLAKNNPHTHKPTAKATLKDIRNVTAAVLEFALENGFLTKNPARGRKIPKYSPVNERRALTQKEQSWIIQTQHRMRLGALIMMFAGLRKGELIALTWSDIDFVERTIFVCRSVEKIDNQYRMKSGTKNGKTRVVSIPANLAQELEQEYKISRSQYVCCKRDGHPHTPSSFRSAWNSYLNTLNLSYGGFPENQSKYDPHGVPFKIDKITCHMLRHTYASLLYQSHVDLLTASKLLGHSEISTTLNIYTHLQEITLKKSIVQWDSYVCELFDKFGT